MCFGDPRKSLARARERLTPEQWQRFEREFKVFCDIHGLPDKWAYWPTYDWARWAFFQGRQTSPAYALRDLYKPAMEYFVNGKPVTPDEYIAWQAGVIEAVTKATLPDPKYYGGSAEEGEQHEVKCAYADGWNDCRASLLRTSMPVDISVADAHYERLAIAMMDDEQAQQSLNRWKASKHSTKE